MTNYGDNSGLFDKYFANRYEQMDELALNIIIRNLKNPEACISNYPPEEQPELKKRVQENIMLASLECTANTLNHSYNEYVNKQKWINDEIRDKYEREIGRAHV